VKKIFLNLKLRGPLTNCKTKSGSYLGQGLSIYVKKRNENLAGLSLLKCDIDVARILLTHRGRRAWNRLGAVRVSPPTAVRCARAAGEGSTVYIYMNTKLS
jgi:hypothetical protein